MILTLYEPFHTGPLFIGEKILLSNESVYGLPWCLNIHGHDHNHMEPYKEGCKHINLAAKALDSTYNRMQWAREEYLLEEVIDEAGGSNRAIKRKSIHEKPIIKHIICLI